MRYSKLFLDTRLLVRTNLSFFTKGLSCFHAISSLRKVVGILLVDQQPKIFTSFAKTNHFGFYLKLITDLSPFSLYARFKSGCVGACHVSNGFLIYHICELNLLLDKTELELDVPEK